ncbi:LysR family transcriptional regulator [Azospirillum sp. TSO35-2]|uniref:LysR family transcriptional regulator n=1 Tax=Azospirillum sp. TSO35-2 TaxID=716796 RepID=UPI000D6160B2|nr:LysR family transcriptional regulator [Azospirillum sp. TSO35-2]PWC39495.1 transcriptional regulator [Azospirillum sp. TSO35-2]
MTDLKGIDLNLLVSLDTLLGELNVTRAAHKLGISQSALSAQLARLRALFGDPLLVPAGTGRGMIATARALDLQAPLHTALKALEVTITRPSTFDPMTAERVFTIAASDNAMVLFGCGLVERLSGTAGPGIHLSFRTPSVAQILSQLESGELDIQIGSNRAVPPTMKARLLVEENYKVVQRKGHPRGTAPLDLEVYCALDHVLVSPAGDRYGYMDEQLEAIGRRRRVVMTVPQCFQAAMMVRTTDYVSTLPCRFVSRLTDWLDMFDLPFDARGFSLYAAWHPRNHADPGHIWLRRQLAEVAAAPASAGSVGSRAKSGG